MADQLGRTPFKFSPALCTWEILMRPSRYGKHMNLSSCAFLVCGWCWQAPNFTVVPTPGYSWLRKSHLGGFPGRMHNSRVLLLCPSLKRNADTFLSRTGTFAGLRYQLATMETLYSSISGYSQPMIAHVVTLFVCHMALKHGFDCLSAKWLHINRSDTNILHFFLIMCARCVLHSLCEDVTRLSIQTRTARTQFSQALYAHMST